jgi:hypothetical protein
MRNYWLERLGSIVAGAGITYASYLATKDIPLNNLWAATSAHQILSQTGPIEACALGILIWVYAKWRKHVVVR